MRSFTAVPALTISLFCRFDWLNAEGVAGERVIPEVEGRSVVVEGKTVRVALAAIVVSERPIPAGPMLILSPPIVTVVGLAPLPMAYVEPLIATWLSPREKVRPSMVIIRGVLADWGR